MSERESAPTDGVTPTRDVYSLPRDTVQTPAISRIGSTVHTPHLQRCHLEPTSMSADEDESAMEHLIVNFEEEQVRLETCGLLGKGGFGKVFAAQSSSGNQYALKVSSKPMRESDWRRLNEEITLMRHFSRHPNIVKLYFAGRDDKRAYVVMERCAGRSLHDLVAQRNLEVQEILWIGWALVNTVAYIHSKGCIHRDLKPQNLLFDVEGNLKITDFGLSSRISEAQPRKTVAGTAMYMAPEMAEEVYKRMVKRNNASRDHTTTDDRVGPSLSYGKEVDTWSIGVVLYVLLTRMNPYIDAMEKCGMRHVDKEQKSLVLFNAVAGAAWSWPRRWTGDLQLCRLVERVLHPDRHQRATLQEVQEDTLWHRRPLSCPLSLLQKLNLLEEEGDAAHARHTSAVPRQQKNHVNRAYAPPPTRHSPTPHALQHVAENIPPTTGGKRTVEQVMCEAVRTLESAEQRARVRLWLACQETFSVLATLLALSRAEAEERRRLVIDEAHTRAVHTRTMRATCYEILTHATRHNPSLLRQGSHESYAATYSHRVPTTTHVSATPPRTARAVSVSLLTQSTTTDEEEEEGEECRANEPAVDTDATKRHPCPPCRTHHRHMGRTQPGALAAAAVKAAASDPHASSHTTAPSPRPRWCARVRISSRWCIPAATSPPAGISAPSSPSRAS